MAGEEREGDDEGGEDDGGRAFEDEVGGMCLEPDADVGQLGDEEIVDEIDVKGADADVLQG